MSKTLTGVYPEKVAAARRTPRWVAIWRYDTTAGRRFDHIPMDVFTSDTTRDEALDYARQHGAA